MDDTFFMQQALNEAKRAYALGEIPVGAVVVFNNRIIAKGHNLTEQLNDPTAHAELLAITAATNYIGGKYLHKCTLYVTLEPCTMCAGALYWAQLARLVVGAPDQKRGYKQIASKCLHPKTQITEGVLANECAAVVKSFFAEKRK